MLFFRRFLDINPSEKGEKASLGNSRRQAREGLRESLHVATLLKNLVGFEWHFIKVS